MALDAPEFIAGPGVQDRPVGQHGAAFLWQVQNIPMTLLALVVFEGGIGGLPVFLVVVSALGIMRIDIFNAMQGLAIEKVKRILGCRQMAVHAIRHKPLAVIVVRGRLPGLVSKPNFMAGGAELRGGGPHHGIIGQAKEGKSNKETKDNPEGRAQEFFHTVNLNWDLVPSCLIGFELTLRGLFHRH
jgi:hypothetical protein